MHGNISAHETEMVMFASSNIEECSRFVTSMLAGGQGWTADIEWDQGNCVAIFTRKFLGSSTVIRSDIAAK
jgi:hypothetical protein